MKIHRIRNRLAVLGSLAAAFSWPAAAQQADITWSSSFLAVNLDSTGAPLDDAFTFYLGVFHPPVQDPAWQPDATNTDQWADYWITADVAYYEAARNHRFASGYTTEPTVAGVSLTGKQGYIWGVNRQVPGEWILITNPTWIWPAHNSYALPKTWTVRSGTALLGEVESGDVHMRTARVSNSLPPLLLPEEWRHVYFTSHERTYLQALVSGWLADPNGNGRTNVVEYALGSNPRSPRVDRPSQLTTSEANGEEFLTLFVQRDPNSQAVLTPLVSDDLENWFGGPPHLTIENESPSSFVVRDATPIGGTRIRFLRLQISVPTP